MRAEALEVVRHAQSLFLCSRQDWFTHRVHVGYVRKGIKDDSRGFLVVWWLRLYTSPCSLIPGWGTNIPHASIHGWGEKKKKRMIPRDTILLWETSPMFSLLQVIINPSFSWLRKKKKQDEFMILALNNWKDGVAIKWDEEMQERSRLEEMKA